MVNKQHSKSTSDSASDKDPMVRYVTEEFEKWERFHSDRFEKAREYIQMGLKLLEGKNG